MTRTLRRRHAAAAGSRRRARGAFLSGPDRDELARGPSVILYAAKPGAFIDLAADLAWLTGRSLTDFVLDRHLILPKAPDAASGPAVAAPRASAETATAARGTS